MEIFDILGYCVNFILIPLMVLILLCIPIDINKIDYIRKKILLVQVIFSISSISANS